MIALGGINDSLNALMGLGDHINQQENPLDNLEGNLLHYLSLTSLEIP